MQVDLNSGVMGFGEVFHGGFLVFGSGEEDVVAVQAEFFSELLNDPADLLFGLSVDHGEQIVVPTFESRAAVTMGYFRSLRESLADGVYAFLGSGKDSHAVGCKTQLVMADHCSEAANHALVNPVGYLFDHVLGCAAELVGKLSKGLGGDRQIFLQQPGELFLSLVQPSGCFGIDS